jgi:hypothetical protein
MFHLETFDTFGIWKCFEENKNVNLIDQLTIEEEMSGLDGSLTALGELIRDNQFDYTKDIETVRSIYEVNSSTMLKFAKARMYPTGKEEDSLSEVSEFMSLFVRYVT